MSIDIQAGLAHPKIDVHCHVSRQPDTDESSDALVACSDSLGVTEMWCSRPITGGRIAPMDEIRDTNDAVLHAMKRHPDRIRGMCFVIPGYYKDAVAEVERCLDAGMIGVKLYNQYTIDNPVVRPILELAVERRIPVLMHAGYLVAREDLDTQPWISWGVHFAVASERYPDAIMIHAHVGGGGDWEGTIRAMRDTSPNLYCDFSGSNLDDDQIAFSAAELGVDRLLYGSDGTMAGSVGKVIGTNLTGEEKSKLFWGNAERILAAQGAAPLRTGEEVAP